MKTSLKKISIPLGPAEMKSFFEDKSQVYWVEYSDSPLKGNVFLTYVANLGLNVEFDLASLPSEEKIELMSQYMTSRHIIKSQTLSIASMQVLMSARGLDPDQDLIQRFFSDEELKNCIATHKDIIEKWIHFLDSSLLYLMTVFEDLAKRINIKDHCESVDDHRYVGLNIVNMFRTEGFFEIYFSIPVQKVNYFTRQFEEYMFNGQNLFEYFNTEENTLLKLLSALINEEVSFKELETAISE